MLRSGTVRNGVVSLTNRQGYPLRLFDEPDINLIALNHALQLGANQTRFSRSLTSRRHWLAVALSFMPLGSVQGFVRDDEFDQNHSTWDALLRKHVHWTGSGLNSTVDYKGFAGDRLLLKGVLDQYSGVTKVQYEAMRRDEKLAFLINVYNAFMIELVLTKYPRIHSIKTIGGVFTKPWSIRFVRLMGEDKHLDHVQHDMVRARGVFDEPRIHFVMNCAAIGCPALRPEAITATKLEFQLEDSTRRFLRDRTRNRFKNNKLEVSKLFDWYKTDWSSGFKGYASLEQFFSQYAELLSDDAAGMQLIKARQAPLAFIEYDWLLNDKK